MKIGFKLEDQPSDNKFILLDVLDDNDEFITHMEISLDDVDKIKALGFVQDLWIVYNNTINTNIVKMIQDIREEIDVYPEL
jgi:hypothetical protein